MKVSHLISVVCVGVFSLVTTSSHGALEVCSVGLAVYGTGLDIS